MAQFWQTLQPQLGRALAYLRDVFWLAFPPTTQTAPEGDPEPATVPVTPSEPVAAPAGLEHTTPEPPEEQVSEPVVGDARVLAMLEARTITEVRALAKAYPELRPPYSFFDDEVNEQLEQVLWRGVSLAKAEVTREDIQLVLETMYARSKVRPLEPYRPNDQ